MPSNKAPAETKKKTMTLSLELGSRDRGAVSLVLLNRKQQVRFTSSRNGVVRASGQIEDPQGGMWVQDNHLVLLGFSGHIEISDQIELVYRSGLDDLEDAKWEHFGPGLKRPEPEERAPAVKAIASVDDLWRAIVASTEPTDRDYFMGAVHPEDPFVISHRARMAEIARFNAASLPPARWRGDVELYGSLGKWLYEIGNAPKVLTRQYQKYWDGCRRCAKIPKQEVVKVVRELVRYNAVYGAHLEATDHWVNDLRKNIQDSITNPPRDLFPDTPSLLVIGAALGALLFGGVAGLSYAAGYTLAASAEAVIGTSAGLGTLFGLGAGEAAGAIVGGKRAEYMAQAQRDIIAFRLLQVRHHHLLEEGVHQRVMGEMTNIMGQYDRDLRMAVGDEEQAAARRRAQRSLEAALRWQRKQLGRDPFVAHIADALKKMNGKAYGTALVNLCNAGNAVSKASNFAKDGRVSGMLDGFASGSIANPMGLPDHLWA
jgi:hypothetical protein